MPGRAMVAAVNTPRVMPLVPDMAVTAAATGAEVTEAAAAAVGILLLPPRATHHPVQTTVAVMAVPILLPEATTAPPPPTPIRVQQRLLLRLTATEAVDMKEAQAATAATALEDTAVTEEVTVTEVATATGEGTRGTGRREEGEVTEATEGPTEATEVTEGMILAEVVTAATLTEAPPTTALPHPEIVTDLLLRETLEAILPPVVAAAMVAIRSDRHAPFSSSFPRCRPLLSFSH